MKLATADLAYKAHLFRKQMGIDDYSPFHFNNLLTAFPKLTIVKCKLSDNISGITYKCSTDVSLIVINSILSSSDSFIALAHEMYHHLFSENGTTITKFGELRNSSDGEINANLFAEYVLAPRNAIGDYFVQKQKSVFCSDAILDICSFFNISPQFAENALLDLKLIDKKGTDFIKDLALRKTNSIWDELSFNKTGNQIEAKGYYLSLAQELESKGMISKSRFEDFVKLINYEV